MRGRLIARGRIRETFSQNGMATNFRPPIGGRDCAGLWFWQIAWLERDPPKRIQTWRSVAASCLASSCAGPKPGACQTESRSRFAKHGVRESSAQHYASVVPRIGVTLSHIQ
jgi:hypothetical protein